jgi:hypothetical protein
VPLRPNFAPKPARGKPQTTFHPFPTLPGELLAGILAGAAGDHAGDPIASLHFFPGASAQNLIFNSKAQLLIIVKSLENRRKLGKLQTQFC